VRLDISSLLRPQGIVPVSAFRSRARPSQRNASRCDGSHAGLFLRLCNCDYSSLTVRVTQSHVDGFSVSEIQYEASLRGRR
jgi:hypothetical protein